MVRLSRWRVALVATGVIAGAGLAACGLYPDPPNVIVPPPAPSVIGTQVVGAVVDSKTSALITQPITLRFLTDTGGAATYVRDTQGHALTSLVVKNGLVSLAVADGTSFPQTLVITASGSGYLPTTVNVPITGPGKYKVVESLASTANPPQGVEVPAPISAGSADATGKTAVDTTVSPPNAPSATDLTLPAATVVTDANGAPLSGTLSATVASYDPQSPTAMAAVPGSLANAVVDNGNGNTSGAIVLGGFTQIFVSDPAGHQAAHFSQPLPATMEIPDTTVNPLTGATLQPGDSAPVYSFDEATGAWKNEGTATIAAGTVAGTLDANFNVTHLSGWAVAWFVSPAQECSLNVPISGNGNNPLNAFAYGNGYADNFEIPAGASSFDVNGLAPALSATIDAYFGGTKVGTITVNSCQASGPMNVTIPASVQPTTLDVAVYNVCKNGSATKSPVPSTAITITAPGMTPVFGITDSSGVAHISGLVAGTTVTVSASNRDPNGAPFDPQTVTLQASNPVVEFDNSTTCTILTGAGN